MPIIPYTHKEGLRSDTIVWIALRSSTGFYNMHLGMELRTGREEHPGSPVKLQNDP